MEVTRKDRVMNLLFKRLLHFFPIITFSQMIYWSYQFIITHKISFLFFAFLTPYLFPLICYRLLILVYPIKEGASYVGIYEKKFSPWLFSLRMQQIYIVFPIFERLLFFLPGIFAIWLRMWGSRVGSNVFFVPNVVIHDRGFLDLGNNIIFGDRAYLSSHFLEVKNGRFFLYLKKIKVESNVFIGAMAYLGPGTRISSNTKVPAGSCYTLNQSEGFCLLKK